MLEVAKKFDLFSQPFIFRVDGNKKGYSTRAGGVYSILMVILILLVFARTIFVWLEGGMQISSFYQPTYESFEFNPDFSPMQWGVLRNLTVPEDIDRYITFRTLIVYKPDEANRSNYSAQLERCGDQIGAEKLKKWYTKADIYSNFSCINYKDVDGNGTRLKLQNEGQYTLQLDVFKCSNSSNATINKNITCASAEEIDNYILSKYFRLVFNFVSVDYDVNKKSLVYSIEDKWLNPSLKSTYWAAARPNCVNMSVTRNYMTGQVDKHAYVQDTDFNVDIFDKQEYVQKFGDFEEYTEYPGQINDHMYRLEYIITNKVIGAVFVYPGFSEVMASFFAFVKMLLFASIIFVTINSMYTNDKMLRTICSQYYQQGKEFKLEMSGFKRAFHYATGGRYLKPKNDGGNNNKDRDSISSSRSMSDQNSSTYARGSAMKEEEVYQQWIQLNNRFMNISNFYKELMLIRNAISMLFTEEQWAALHFTGRRMDVLKSFVDKVRRKQEEEQQRQQEYDLYMTSQAHGDSKGSAKQERKVEQKDNFNLPADGEKSVVEQEKRNKLRMKARNSLQNRLFGNDEDESKKTEKSAENQSQTRSQANDSMNKKTKSDAEKQLNEPMIDVIDLQNNENFSLRSSEGELNHLESIEVVSTEQAALIDKLEQFLVHNQEFFNQQNDDFSGLQFRGTNAQQVHLYANTSPPSGPPQQHSGVGGSADFEQKVTQRIMSSIMKELFEEQQDGRRSYHTHLSQVGNIQ